MSAGDGIGSFLSGVASGANAATKQDQYDKLARLLEQQPAAAAAVTPPAPTGAPAAPGSAQPVSSSDPVATDLAPHQRAFLNAISDGESGGKYNIRYTPSGGATFDDLSKHPGILEPTADGKKSSAAGRYQFTKSTWEGMGGGEFTPENQDRMAWKLAQSDYHARTGRDLDGDLQTNGMTPAIMKALQPTWTSFGSKQDQHAQAYNASMARYALPAAKSIMTDDTKSDAKGGRTAMQIMGDLYPAARGIM